MQIFVEAHSVIASMIFDILVKYTKKSSGKCYLDYLGPKYFNEMQILYKKNMYLTRRIKWDKGCQLLAYN